MMQISLSRQQLMALNLGLLSLVIMSLVYAIWDVRADWQLARPIANDAIPLIKSDENTESIASIPGAHLFGQALIKDGEVPISHLQLRVTGIVKTETDTQTLSKAYISMAGQTSKIYQAGDSLVDGIKIYAITADAIILENDGQLEKLPMSREKLQFKARSKEYA